MKTRSQPTNTLSHEEPTRKETGDILEVSQQSTVLTNSSHILYPEFVQSSAISRYIPTNIDFDEASREWNANKKRIGQMYVYMCEKKLGSGLRCKHKARENSEYCYQHGNLP